jgi:glycosyltransferase involved in cell wall biosynthesis
MVSLQPRDAVTSRERKRVLVVGPLAHTGGVSRYVRQLLARRSDGCVYSLFDTARAEKRSAPSSKGYGIILSDGWLHAFRGLLVTLEHMLAFPRLLRRADPDLVHVCGVSHWGFWENAYYMAVCRARAVPVTMHYLGSLDQYWEGCGCVERHLVRRALRLPWGMAVLSRRARQVLLQIVPFAHAVVIPSSVEPAAYAEPSNRRWPSDDKVRMLFVGGQDPYRKGLREVLAVAEVLSGFDPDWVFVVTGPVAEAAARANGEWTGDNVCFTGRIPVDDMVALYHSADVLVLPSHNEGLPYVVVEAMACGLPIIASSVGGIPEVVAHGKTGLLIGAGDVRDLERAVQEVASDAAKRRRFGAAAERFVEEHLSSDKCLADLERFFGECLVQGPRS